MKITGIGVLLLISTLQIASADWRGLLQAQKKLKTELENELRNFNEYKDNVTIDLYWHMNQMISTSLDVALHAAPIAEIGHPGVESENLYQRDCIKTLAKHHSTSRKEIVDAIEPCVTEYHHAILPIFEHLESLIATGEELLEDLQEADRTCESQRKKETCLKDKLDELKANLVALRGTVGEVKLQTAKSEQVQKDRATKCLHTPISAYKRKTAALTEIPQICA